MKKKIKPTAHKNENTFRFQTFSERLSFINAGVIHQIGRASELPEQTETFFSEALEKWIDLNYTEDFDALQQALGRDLYSLPQLVFHKERIIGVLRNHLQATSHALPAVLELVVALARDLQSDFYPQFPSIFSLLLDLLTVHDADVLEKVFSCLAYLFKYLWKFIVQDIKPVFRLYSPLLCISNKEYVRNFAAESFAFIIRKVPDKRKILQIMMKNLQKNASHATGTGQLLFEVMKGVKEQLHSCTENVLRMTLDMLGSDDSWKSVEPVKAAILECSKAIAKHVSPDYCGVIWKVFSETLMKFQHDTLMEEKGNHILCILEIFLPFVEYKDAFLLQEPSQIFKVMTNLLHIPSLSHDCTTKVLGILTCILHSRSVSVSTNDIHQFFSEFYKMKLPFQHVCEFTKKLFAHQSFETSIFPRMLEFCEENVKDYSHYVLDILTSLIISKSHFCDTTSLSSADLDFSSACYYSRTQATKQLSEMPSKNESSLYQIIQQYIEVPPEDKFYERIPVMWAALVCLPYFKHLTFGKSCTADKVQLLCEKVHCIMLKTDFHNVSFKDSYAFLFKEAMSSALKTDPERFLNDFQVCRIVDLLRLHSTSVPVLLSAVLYFNHLLRTKPEKDMSQDLEGLYDIIKFNLSSHDHKVRRLSLQIFSSFPLEVPTSNNEQGSALSRSNVFEICLQAEEISADVQNIRQKLMYLQKLEYNGVQKVIPIGPYQSVPLYYLLGCLHINFSLLWPPVQELINSHALNLGKIFWEIYTLQLQRFATLCEENLLNESSSNTEEHFSGESPLTGLLRKQFASECLEGGCQKPDVTNYRNLLWKAMELFPATAESRNRDLVPLLLQFIQKEYCLVDSSISSSQDIRKFTECIESNELDNELSQTPNPENSLSHDKENIKDECDENDVEPDLAEDVEIGIKDDPPEINSEENCNAETVKCFEENQEKEVIKTHKEDNSPANKKRRKATSKSLCCFLSVFSKFQNPRALYQEPEVHKLYLQLLTHPDNKVQKLAFDCILTYSDKFLTTYKQNFYNLLDNKTFKTEIVLFSLDSEFGVIHEDDRQSLLPVLMRILYGKMLSKVGPNTSGRNNINLRRSIVIRFLGACSAQELKFFLQLVFSPFQDLESDALEVIEKVSSSLNLSTVLPLKQQLSFINTLDVVFVQLGNLITDLLPWLLKIVLAISSMATAVLDKRDQIYSGYVPVVRRLRSMATSRLVQFFTVFDSYPFSATEIDAIFEAAVWPQLPRLELEGFANSNALLRLVTVWSSNPRFFTLLGKYKVVADGTKLSILPELMKLYTSPKAHGSVLNIISKIVENLLTYQDFSEECNADLTPSGPKIEVNNEMECCADFDFKGALNYGSLLLLPHVPQILQRLQLLVERIFKSSNKLLSMAEQNILCRISEFINDQDQSGSLVKMLIKFLIKSKRRNQEVEVGTLTTVRNLISKVEDSFQYISSLSVLFFILQSRQSRSILCNILETIADHTPSCLQEVNIIKKLNSWNPKIMEEPDYNTRLEGFQEAQMYIRNEANEYFQPFVLLIIQNCTYFIIHVNDPAIRDNSSFTLQVLAEIMAPLMKSNPEKFKLLVTETLLEKLKKGLCNKNENVRHEFIQVLSSFLRFCGSHPSLQGLAQLCNEDMEIDFWENIRHIQFHRRARVMRRLSQALSDGSLTVPSTNLASYILPIASAFLYENLYSKHNSLVDAAIELIGSICSHLPWNRYKISLLYYLSLLFKNTEHNKTTIKVLVAILDAFHFDLTKSNFVPVNIKRLGVFQSKNIEDENVEQNDIHNNEPEVEGLPDKDLDEKKATNIHETIAKSLLPRLHGCLTQKTVRDEDHKVNKSDHPEDNEVLRIPIALAMVKLLQKLPEGTVNQNLPGVFLKVVQFLRSRADSIRTIARDTLSKIMLSLGPKYFRTMLQEMKGSLFRGYQVHVMTYTVHSVLTNLRTVLAVGDLDDCISFISELCLGEIFGDTAEEKEVDKIAGKLKEARSSKSFATYHILGEFVSEKCLEQLVSPLANVLSNVHSQKKVQKAEECFRQILMGISNNKDLSAKTLLIFGYQYVTCGLQDMTSKSNKCIASKKAKRPDVFLIPTEPPRGGFAAKASSKTNAHVLVDFGLQILYVLLKRGKFTAEVQEHLEMLNSYVPIVSNYLSSKNMKVISTCLRCAAWLIKFTLPSLKEEIGKIVGHTFVLLNKYSGPGMAQGENFEVVVMCFKLLTTTLREVTYYQMTSEQMRVLLIYIDQDCHDNTRQATAFPLLKAVLSRHLDSPELPAVMKKISNLAIISEQDNIRAQSRQVLHMYLLEYPLGKVLADLLGFLVVQLQYEYESGRISALEMLNTVFTSFPIKTLQKHSGLFFVPLSACLVNDASSKCRQMAAMCIKVLLSRLESNDRTSLFLAVVSWLKDTKSLHQRLGAQLLGLFAETEKEEFDHRLDLAIPIFKELLAPEQYFSESEECSEKDNLDSFLYQLLSSLLKVLAACKGLLTEVKYQPDMSIIWEYVQKHLLHGHTWVRLSSCQLYGMLFASHPVEDLVSAFDQILQGSKQPKDFYLLVDTKRKLRTLSSDFCSQLTEATISEAHAEQVVRNLVYLSKVIRRFPVEVRDKLPEIPVSISWIFHRLRKEVNKEVSLNPSVTSKRMSVFRWIAAIAIDMDKEEVVEMLPSFLKLLCRELADNSVYLDPQLKILAQEVSDLLRSLVGVDIFTRELVQAQTSLSRKKAHRKAEKAVEAVKNPEVASRRKIKKNLKKQESKKRRLESLGTHPSKNKKPKLSDLVIFS